MSLWDTLRIPARVPINVAAFVSYILPPVVCCFVVALLAITPKTRAIRLAFWPVVALLAWRAVVSVDMSLGRQERRVLNVNFALFMFTLAARALGWTLAEKPLVRYLRPANTSPSRLMDAFDLFFNLRGHGWDWSRGSYIPRETRPTNRMAFVFSTLHSVLVHALICGVFNRAETHFGSFHTGPDLGKQTIFDNTLQFHVRYCRAGIITTHTTLSTYLFVQLVYDLCTILGVLLLGQDPAQWPPAFDAPWRATSLSEYWGRSWHQFFRQIFLVVGGHPLSLVLGRTGKVLGSFLASALFHNIAILALNGQGEFWRMLVGFGMMAPGILAEEMYRQWTGKKVGGVVGWIWMMMWLHLWGSVVVEGYARGNMLRAFAPAGSVLPVATAAE